MKRRVIIGLLGPTLDRGRGSARWEYWRPTVSLCQHEDLLVDRLELLHQTQFDGLAEQVEQDIATVSPETRVARHTIEFDDAWDFDAVYGALFDFARSYPFDPDHEEYLLHITTGTHVAQICLFLLAESRHLPAKLIQTSPPRKRRGDKHKGPGEFSVIDLDLSKYDKIAQCFEQETLEGLSFLKAGIDTRDPAYNRLIEQIEHVAINSRHPMLLTGPTGADKSQLAKRVFELKQLRRQVAGRFVEVNCATLRGDSAMSALFGHTKGAFTGATADRKGLLREADGGLLFLDEVGELGLDEQAMLLRAIEEQRFMPVGGDRDVASQFQLICGTNRDLAAAVAEGRFREDLLARINLWAYRLPGLAQRRADIEPNLDYELDRIARETGRQVRFNKEARAAFMRFALAPDSVWSANFRDLGAAVTRMATLAPAGRITIEQVEEETDRLRAAWHGQTQDTQARSVHKVLGDTPIDLFDQAQLAQVIATCREAASLSDAGRKLFHVSRTKRKTTNDADRLRKYLAKFGLDWDAVSG
ncbi:MAG: RNA repair transcriptional activator RtcR [Phycisphaerales bacterium JB063]